MDKIIGRNIQYPMDSEKYIEHILDLFHGKDEPNIGEHVTLVKWTGLISVKVALTDREAGLISPFK